MSGSCSISSTKKGTYGSSLPLPLRGPDGRGVRGVQAKFDRYGPMKSMSSKQYRQVTKLTKKHAMPKQTDDHRSSKQINRARPQHRQRRHGWRPSLGLALAAIVLGFVLVYKGAERFPEYLGPVVVISSSQEIVGPVTHVRDGDTIEVSSVPIRFGSLDCAETGTSDGNRATQRMRALVGGQTLTCFLNGRTSYDRQIGSCRLQDGRDLGSVMIREGYCQRFW